MTMRNEVSATQCNQHDDYKKRYQTKIERRLLIFSSREVNWRELKRVNEVLFSLWRKMEEYSAYDQIYK